MERADSSFQLDFSTNDYLGLSNNEQLKTAATYATSKYGTGGRSSRLVSGLTELYQNLERDLARFFETETATIFGSGYLTNLGVICSLADSSTTVVADHKVHASIIDGIKLSGAKLLRFRHNDLNSFAQQISRVESKRVLIAVESVYSMDGDLADVQYFVDYSATHSIPLLVDEAHALGVYGKGLARSPHENVIVTGTFSKAFGSYGGVVAASEKIKELIVNKSRSLIYSTALPPSVLGSIGAALKIIKSESNLGLEVLQKSERLRSGFVSAGFDVSASCSHIVPLVLGTRSKELAMKFAEESVKVPYIKAPTVPEGKERLRFSVCQHHSNEDIDYILERVLG